MRFDFILIGCLIALLWRNSDYKKIRTQHSNAMFGLGFLSIAVGWIISYKTAVYPSFSDMNTIARLVQQEFITIAVGGGASMILIALVAGSCDYKILIQNRLLSGIGVISYSVYLWQQFFFFESSLPHWMMYLPVRLFLIFSFAIVSYFFIEKPFAGLRQKLHSNTSQK
jgi:peptidoglycan/LPS O-acetylase OafA/YrhL